MVPKITPSPNFEPPLPTRWPPGPPTPRLLPPRCLRPRTVPSLSGGIPGHSRQKTPGTGPVLRPPPPAVLPRGEGLSRGGNGAPQPVTSLPHCCVQCCCQPAFPPPPALPAHLHFRRPAPAGHCRSVADLPASQRKQRPSLGTRPPPPLAAPKPPSLWREHLLFLSRGPERWSPGHAASGPNPSDLPGNLQETRRLFVLSAA